MKSKCFFEFEYPAKCCCVADVRKATFGKLMLICFRAKYPSGSLGKLVIYMIHKIVGYWLVFISEAYLKAKRSVKSCCSRNSPAKSAILILHLKEGIEK